jgi:hypothetical protein
MTPPTVMILAESFLPFSEVYAYRRAVHLRQLHPVVACFSRQNAEAFPFEPVHELKFFSPNILTKGTNFLLRRLGLIAWQDSVEGIRRFKALLKKVKPALILCEGGYVAARLVERTAASGLPVAITFWGTDINAARSKPEYLAQLGRVFKHGSLFIYCCAARRSAA